ncbi:MAG: hypothetical protein RL637_885, partial [Pseudomonadota bacterium]
MKNQLVNLIIVLLFSGCGYNVAYLPDKTRDYQFAYEIPALQLPSTLQQHDQLQRQVPPKPLADQPEAVKVVGEVVKSPISIAENAVADQSTQNEQSVPLTVNWIDRGSATVKLQLNQSLATSWRLLDKILMRQSIEVSDRDQAHFQFIVHYHPDVQIPKEESIWHELKFVFADKPTESDLYQIRLLTQAEFTQIAIFNQQNQLMAEGIGLQ